MLHILARLILAQGDFARARPLIERVLAIYERAFGSEHPETGMILNTFAYSLGRQGDLAGARRLLERALAIAEKGLGPDRYTSVTHSNLARLLEAEGDLVGALPLYERALAIYEKVLVPSIWKQIACVGRGSAFGAARTRANAHHDATGFTHHAGGVDDSMGHRGTGAP
jgi:tetratricopeptide (TPR) repeat protein